MSARCGEFVGNCDYGTELPKCVRLRRTLYCENGCWLLAIRQDTWCGRFLWREPAVSDPPYDSKSNGHSCPRFW